MKDRKSPYALRPSFLVPPSPPLGPAFLVALSLLASAGLTIGFVKLLMPVLPESSFVRIATILFAAFAVSVLASAAVSEVWPRIHLPGRGPHEFLPHNWLVRRLATRRVWSALRELSATPTRDPLEALKELARALEKRDLDTRAHSGRVSRLASQMLERLGMSPQECELARLAGLLHDMGKLSIPDSILFKPGPLDDAEIAIMQTHPVVGADLVEPFTASDVVEAVLHHHERVDGSGYPEGVPASTLGIIARAIPVCDTYDALISDRTYHAGVSKEDAFDELRAAAGSQLDPELVEILIESEKSKTSLLAGVSALLPIGPILRRARHAVTTSTAPASAAVAVATATTALLAGVGVSPPARPPHALMHPPSAVAQAVVVAPGSQQETLGEAPTKEPVPRQPKPAAAVPAPSSDGGGQPSAPLPSDKPCRLPTGTDLPMLPVVGCAADLIPLH